MQVLPSDVILSQLLLGTSGFDRGRRYKVAGRGATALVKQVANNNWQKRASLRSLIKAARSP